MQLTHATSTPATPAAVPNAVLATWREDQPGGAMLHALHVLPLADGRRDTELVRVPEALTDPRPATVTYVEPPVHPNVDRASAALRDAILAADLTGYALVPSDRDPRAGYRYLDADATRPSGHYREVPIGALPTVDAAITDLVAALHRHGITEPLR